MNALKILETRVVFGAAPLNTSIILPLEVLILRVDSIISTFPWNPITLTHFNPWSSPLDFMCQLGNKNATPSNFAPHTVLLDRVIERGSMHK